MAAKGIANQFFLSFFLVFPHFLSPALSRVFNVLDYGAVGDGVTDDTQAFKNAWDATCNSEASSPSMHVPWGKTFLLQPFTFNGDDCRSSSISVQIDGEIVAPSYPSAWNCNGDNHCSQWISFEHFNGLFIHGSGTINPRGNLWWPLTCRQNKRACGRKPTGFTIAHSTNVGMEGLTFKDSPNMHMAIERSSWVDIGYIRIQAPVNSPNTDGIHIQASQNVSVHHSLISTGDDCISIGDGTSYLNISKLFCGPGHGISIGSLGKDGANETVEFVHVNDVVFSETTNGVRIKTWQGGKGHVRNIIFENIRCRRSTRPIIIDQFYCDKRHCTNQTSAVEISNVWYNHIRGTTEDTRAIELACSEAMPCRNIFMNDVHLKAIKKHHGHKQKVVSASSCCINVHGMKNGTVIPHVPCLNQDKDNVQFPRLN